MGQSGNGGNMYASTTLTGNGNVNAEAAGDAGFAHSGTNGTAVGIAVATGTGTTSGQSAVNAGVSVVGYSATATATATGAGPDAVESSTNAFAGGGNATATSISTGPASATSFAFAQTDSGETASGIATALATATAPDGRADAGASALSGDLLNSVSTNSEVLSNQAVSAEGVALIGQAAPFLSLDSSLQGGTLGVGLPVASDVNTFWNGSTNVQTAFENAANVQGLGILSGGDPTAAGAGISVFTSSIDYTFDASLFGSRDLLVGLLDPSVNGTGMQGSGELKLEIDWNNTAVFQETFTSNAAFLAFARDDVLNLGALTAGLSGIQDLQFDLQYINFDLTPGSFNTGLVFGAIATPEPSTAALLTLGALGLLGRLAVARARRLAATA